MAILNYTTSIEASKTVVEVQALLLKQGAKRISIEYDGELPTAIEFSLQTDTLGLQHFYFAPNVSGVLLSLQAEPKVPSKSKTRAQAVRVAWRIEKTRLEAQFAKLEATKMPLEQIMLPYMVINPGATLYDSLKAQHLALTTGDK